MGKFIEFECELYRKSAKCHIRIESISYIGPADVDDKTVVGFADENTFVVHGTPAEVMAKIEAAESEPVRAATMRVEDLREGDELDIGGHRMAFKWVRRDGDLAFSNISGRPNDLHAPQSQIAEMLARGVIVRRARGVIVRRDGNVISGWPV
jgi:hypothetical protein